MTHARRAFFIASTLAFPSFTALADETTLASSVSFNPPPSETLQSLPHALAVLTGAEPPTPPAPDQNAKPAEAPPKPGAFGDAGTTWLKAGFGMASNLGSTTDTALSFSWAYFVANNFEIGLELDAWHFQQPGDNAIGFNPNFYLHWHFYNDGTWTTFAEVGIGILVASDVVPENGTGFDLMPRVGVGFTRRLTDDLRLEAGLRWHHISNARIEGDHHNPSRDLPMVYVGLIFPF